MSQSEYSCGVGPIRSDGAVNLDAETRPDLGLSGDGDLSSNSDFSA